ncbi:ATP-dependent 6-phosphofructokinase, partial [Staphylococcus aureus]|nr:ATP-dependent 6-phosphofructokinase [Staphylococcus aureus]
AVELLKQGETAKGVGIKNNQLTATPFDDIFGESNHKFDKDMYQLAKELSI